MSVFVKIINRIKRFRRKLWYRSKIRKGIFGKNCFGSGIPELSFLEGGLKVGENCKFNPDTFINARGGVNIGSNCSFSKGVRVLASSLDPERIFYQNHDRTHKGNGIKIGNNVWLATNVIVLDEVEIVDNVIVGAGAVVVKSLKEQYAVYAGNPAVMVKKFEPPADKYADL